MYIVTDFLSPSSQLNKCIGTENECPSLDHPDNGYVTFTEGRRVGAKVWYTCDLGHRLVGSESRSCGRDLTWSGKAPSCVAGKPCTMSCNMY